jgi:hypothetical protein
MKLLKHGIMFSAFAFALASCSDEGGLDLGKGEGAIRLALRTSAEVVVSAPTRAESATLTAPEAGHFAVRLTKSDNSYSKTWDSIEEFNAEEAFRTGSYTLEAFVGDIDTEGFDAPYFYGAADVSVLEAKETQVAITAALANSMVSVDYTEGFKSYFKDYSARVHSAGHSYIDFAADETRPAFIAPGEVDLTVSFTNPQGQSTSLQPAGFTAKPRHHYRVKFDVAEGTGNAVLKIIFDDTLVSEDVTIDLTDELFTTPAPEVKAEGFVSDSPVEALEGNAPASPFVFTAVARGGMAEASLTVDSQTVPAFGREVNLVGASAALQQQIASSGISAVGFFKNPDKLARLDVTEFVKSLPAGTHRISLVVKDRYTRVSDPVTLVVSTEAIHLEAQAEDVVFGSNQAFIDIEYNGADPDKAFTFKALDKFGVYKDCPITEVKQKAGTRSFPVKNYVFTLTLPDTERESIPLQIFFHGEKRTEIEIPVITPKYSVEADAFAKYVVLKVVPEDASQLGIIVNSLKVAVSATRSARNGGFTFVRDADNGLVTVKGFNPATPYTITTKLSAATDAAPVTSTSVTTEAATDVPNGDFSQTHQTINMTAQVGGTWTGTIFSNPKYHINAPIVRAEATGWASINANTCWSGSSNINTWYTVPSTWADNGNVTVRSVGYSHSGSDLGSTKETLVYYCKNTPTFDAGERISGELFLGTYSFDGNESRTDGITFGSRPASLSFDYTYVPYGDEKGLAYVAVFDESGRIIATGSMNLNPVGVMTTETISLSGYPFSSRAASLQVRFLSTANGVPGISIPSGSALKEHKHALGNQTLDANRYNAVATGSVLVLDNVKLNY